MKPLGLYTSAFVTIKRSNHSVLWFVNQHTLENKETNKFNPTYYSLKAKKASGFLSQPLFLKSVPHFKTLFSSDVHMEIMSHLGVVQN